MVRIPYPILTPETNVIETITPGQGMHEQLQMSSMHK